MIVLDASAAVELLLNTPSGRRLAARVRSTRISLHAPHLMDIEVAQVLRRYIRGGVIDGDRGRLALEHLSLMDVNRYGHEELLDRVWALKENLTAYDAVYVALAEVLGAPLITGDGRLAGASGVRAQIQLLV